MNLSPFSGEQIVQVTNPDPFAKPVLRSPVLHTPVWMIACAQLLRLLWRLIKLTARHPVASLILAVLVLSWRMLGWPGPVITRRSPHRQCRGLADHVARLLDPSSSPGRCGDGGAAGTTTAAGPRS